jgi:hypothetical protein
MANNMMWFGNRNKMQWVPCPAVGVEVRNEGRTQTADYVTGGAFRRTTKNAAKGYNLSWNRTKRDNLRPITDYAEGVYGDGAMFWSDPFTMDKNVLAQSFATPSLGTRDAITLTGSDTRPDRVVTSANSNGFPYESALYTVSGTTNSVRHWVPIPPGYTAHVGVNGVAGSGGVMYARRTTGPTTGETAVALTLLPVTGDTRFNHSVVGGDNIGLELYIGGTGSITLSGMMVQILPTGSLPSSGAFISGQGHSGCTFNEHPNLEAYSAEFDLVGLSVDLIETEQWK